MDTARHSGDYPSCLAVLLVAEWLYLDWATRPGRRRCRTSRSSGSGSSCTAERRSRRWVAFLRAELDRVARRPRRRPTRERLRELFTPDGRPGAGLLRCGIRLSRGVPSGQQGHSACVPTDRGVTSGHHGRNKGAHSVTAMSDLPLLGVEEEFHVVDLETRHSAPEVDALLARLDGAEFAPELQRSLVETNTPVCGTLDELRGHLRRLRATLESAAEPARARRGGRRHGAAGRPVERRASPRARATSGCSTSTSCSCSEQHICGAQVHVDVPDRDVAVQVVRRVAPYLPTLLAISASSPYWRGRDTGYASFRSAWCGRAGRRRARPGTSRRRPTTTPGRRPDRVRARSATPGWSTSTSGPAPTCRPSSCGSATPAPRSTTSC